MLALHCPHCGYNLTGLPENRCPECGLKFDPAVLAAGQAPAPPLDWWGVCRRLMVLPSITWLFGGLFLFDNAGGALLVLIGLPIVALVQLVAGPICAWYRAGRLAEGRALSEQRVIRPGDRGYVWGWTLGLLLLQYALTGGSMVAIWYLADIEGLMGV